MDCSSSSFYRVGVQASSLVSSRSPGDRNKSKYLKLSPYKRSFVMQVPIIPLIALPVQPAVPASRLSYSPSIPSKSNEASSSLGVVPPIQQRIACGLPNYPSDRKPAMHRIQPYHPSISSNPVKFNAAGKAYPSLSIKKRFTRTYSLQWYFNTSAGFLVHDTWAWLR